MLPLQAQINMGENFIIPLSGLAAGQTDFLWKVGKEFFESFDNTEILEAEIVARVVVEKSGRYTGVDCEVEGSVTVECDRCLEALELPVNTSISLSVKYGEGESSSDPHEGEREVVFVSEDDAQLDMSQIVYDYICVSLPMQRHHDEGECDPDTVRYLGNQSEKTVESLDENNPFAALKNIF